MTKTTTTKTAAAKFYVARAAKIARARKANAARGLSVRAQRAVARADRAFLLSVAGL